jgi:hypothetical protein
MAEKITEEYLMNELIAYCSQQGLGKTMYDVFFALGFVSVLCGLLWYGKKLQLPLWQITVTVLIVYPIVVAWMSFMFWMETGFRSFGGNNIVRIFVYVPLIGLPVARWLKIDKKRMLSLLSFGPLLVHGISHLGLVEVTRQRTRAPLSEVMEEECAVCDGRGRVGKQVNR